MSNKFIGETPTVGGGWHYTAGRLSRQLCADELPFGRHTAATAAAGVQLPAEGVAVLTASALTDLSSPSTYVVLPSHDRWSTEDARLVAAYIARGFTIGVVTSGKEPLAVTNWWGAAEARVTAASQRGRVPRDVMLTVGQLTHMLDLEAASMVVTAGAINAVESSEILNKSVIVWASSQLSYAESRDIAAVRAAAQRVIIVSPRKVLDDSDPWLSGVDRLIIVKGGDGRWCPAGTNVTAWRTVEEELVARAARREAKAIVMRQKEERRELALAQRAQKEATRQRQREATVRQRQAALEATVLAEMRSQGKPAPPEGQPAPAGFWEANCPLCDHGPIDLPPSRWDQPAVISCPSCRRKLRRSPCSRCAEWGVLPQVTSGDLCGDCRASDKAARRQAAEQEREATRQPKAPPKKRRWFNRG